MKERRFVPSGRRVGDSVRMALREAIDGCPAAITKVRAKRIELEAYIAAGLMTRERAQASYLKFASLIIAHVREHGPESEAEVASE